MRTSLSKIGSPKAPECNSNIPFLKVCSEKSRFYQVEEERCPYDENQIIDCRQEARVEKETNREFEPQPIMRYLSEVYPGDFDQPV